MKLYHGGKPGLRPGDMILPPAETGAPTTADYGAGAVCRRDRVYLTSSAAAGAMFASMHPTGRGDLYEVEAVGPLAHDPDCNTGCLSFEAERAVVVRRLRVPGNVRRKVLRAFGVRP